MRKMTQLGTAGVVSLLVLILTACGFEETELEKQREADDNLIKSYLSENGIEATRDQSGIYYEVLTENPAGAGVAVNDVISIYYNIATLDGQEIERTNDSLAPVRFLHDYQSVIPLGLDYAVQLMKEGEKYRLYIPSTLAYGGYSSTDYFGPNANFIVDLEIVALQTEEDVYDWEIDSIHNYIDDAALENVEALSSGLFFKSLEEGTGPKPSDYNTVSFHFRRMYLDSTVIENTFGDDPVTIPLNRGYAVAGLEQGLKKLNEGGKALMIMPSKIGFKSSVQVIPTSLRDQLVEDQVLQLKVEPYTPIMYEVELVDIF